MPWGNRSGRTKQLPKDWARRRKAQLEHDGWQCTYVSPDTGARCAAQATDVHHVDGAGNDEALTSLCSWHHDKITASQGATSQKRVRERRPTEQHPGIDMGE